MKILHVIPAVAAQYGGPSRAIFDMCRSLQGRGTKVLVATTDADGHERLPVELGLPLEYRKVPTIFFPRYLGEALKYSPALARWLNANVQNFDAVHIHAVFSHACLAAAQACQRHRVPYVVRPLGTLDPWSLKQKSFRKQVYWRLGGRAMLKKAAAVHYTTLEERRLVEASLTLTRGVVIPLGVDEELLQFAKPTSRTDEPAPFGEQNYILVLSRLHQKKGLELLLPAFLSLRKRSEFASWRLILAGDGEATYVNSLKRLVQADNGNGSVAFVGWLEGERKRAALQWASLLALPSYQENFGLCVVEALACGVPVLVSPQVNLAPEIKAAGAGWVAPLERDALECVLAETLRDSKARAQRGAAGRELVRCRFVWKAVASELSALYDSIM